MPPPETDREKQIKKLMKKILLIAFSLSIVNLLITTETKAQTKADTSWKKGGFISLNLSQTQYTNWAAGGENSFALNGLSNTFYNYRKEKMYWENSLDLAYGLVKLNKFPIRKSDDKIELNSKFGKLASGKFYYSALLNFKSQFSPGYNYPDDSTVISQFLAPAYLTIALGMDYKPNDYFSMFLSPATGRFTIVNNETIADAGTYGNEAAVFDSSGTIITHGKKIRSEFGASFNAKFQKDIIKNVNLMAKLNLFNNYTDKVAANRANIDVNFEALLAMKVNKYLSASIYANAIYDNDILVPVYSETNGVKTQIGTGPRLQLKDVIGVGFAYKF